MKILNIAQDASTFFPYYHAQVLNTGERVFVMTAM
jgi:hypothetical protein